MQEQYSTGLDSSLRADLLAVVETTEIPAGAGLERQLVYWLVGQVKEVNL